MKTKTILTLALLFFWSISARALTRTVNNLSDAAEEGTLRVVLQAACDDAGDDDIWFDETTASEVTVNLNSELVIPSDCVGTVTLHGSPSADTILDASLLSGAGREAGDACIINVYSDNNTISNFSLINHQKGAGVCFFGRNNRIENSRLGTNQAGEKHSNRYGVVVSNNFSTAGSYEDMDGSGSQIVGNTINFNFSHGVFIKANEAVLSQNTILANGGCPDEDLLASQTIGCVTSDQEEGFGVYVEEDSDNIVIGGDEFDTSANTIQFNKSGGVVVAGAVFTSPFAWFRAGGSLHISGTMPHFILSFPHAQVLITHNIISKNYGAGEGIDLANDGFTENDTGDKDRGPNQILNYVDHFQTYELVPASDGTERFWTWGIAESGSHIEIYRASEEDVDRGSYHGGGDSYVTDLDVVDNTFSIDPADSLFADGDLLTSLDFTDSDVTSEFAYSVFVGVDEDYDGILNADESDSNSGLADSDGDFLSDAFEDKDHNGVCETDLGETCANNSDTDSDGLSDYVESHGDGIYDENTDTDPLVPDTDADGLNDGAEDKNGNGIYEPYLNETNPLWVDSDDDGVNDGADNCPSVYNPGQEANYCQT